MYRRWLDLDGTTATLTLFHTDDMRIAPKCYLPTAGVEQARLAHWELLNESVQGPPIIQLPGKVGENSIRPCV
jgi:hypothetical protein